MTGSRNYRPPSGTHNYIFDPGQINIALENSNRVLVPVFTGPIHLSISGLSHPSTLFLVFLFFSRGKICRRNFSREEEEEEKRENYFKNYFKNCVYLIIDFSLSPERGSGK